jgi:uncharacterized RDD family membrane protein YckC
MIATVQPARPLTAATHYGGLVTRTIAFALDVVIVDVAALTVGAIVAIALSPLHLPDDVSTVLLAVGAALAVVWFVGYFAWFWSVAGQTPGDRVLGLRVVQATTGRPLRWPRAALRVGALILSAIPFCAGFLMILFDDRRRALHDRLVGTVVLYVTDQPPPPESPSSGDVALARRP